MHFYFPKGLVVVALLPLRRSQEASRVFFSLFLRVRTELFSFILPFLSVPRALGPRDMEEFIRGVTQSGQQSPALLYDGRARN